jgi:hypothetical protein
MSSVDHGSNGVRTLLTPPFITARRVVAEVNDYGHMHAQANPCTREYAILLVLHRSERHDSYCERRARQVRATIERGGRGMLPAPATGTAGKEGGDDRDDGCSIIPSSHPPIIPFTPLRASAILNHQLKSPGSTTNRLSRPTKARRRDGNAGCTRAVRRAPAKFRTPAVAASRGDGGSQLSRVDLHHLHSRIAPRVPVTATDT